MADLVAAVIEVGRAVLGVGVVLVPGLILVLALWPGVARRPGAGVVLLGLALAAIPLGGLALNLLPIGLQPVSWLALGLGLIAIAVALPGSTRFRVALLRLPEGRSFGTIAMYAAAAVLLVAGFAIAGARGEVVTERFSQAWLVPAEDVAGGPPSPTATAQVGVRNLERMTTTYRIDLRLDDRTIRSWSVTLTPGETWTADIDQAVATDARLEARVYLVDDPSAAYRVVSLAGPLRGPG